MANKPYHTGRRYKQARAWIQQAAGANPRTLCQKCGRTADQHDTHRNGRAQHWQAGHSINGSTTWQLWTDIEHIAPPGDWLAPEMSRCNATAGNTQRYGNALGL